MSDTIANSSVAIRVSQLARSFGKRRAVDGLDLTIQRGELFGLLGPNGAGKTTIIKMLCCLLKPGGGEAQIMGRDIRRDPLGVKEVIGVSPQESALAENLNARENLRLVGGSHGLSRDTVDKRAADLLELMKLTRRADEKTKNYSGGMKRRLSIAMALVADPEVLFLDEPTLGLDLQSRADMWEHIERLKGHKTVILTTHYLEEADALADRIAIMDEGKIVAQGTAQELKNGIGGTVVSRSGEPRPTTLDDVFLHYTGRELRE